MRRRSLDQTWLNGEMSLYSVTASRSSDSRSPVAVLVERESPQPLGLDDLKSALDAISPVYREAILQRAAGTHPRGRTKGGVQHRSRLSRGLKQIRNFLRGLRPSLRVFWCAKHGVTDFRWYIPPNGDPRRRLCLICHPVKRAPPSHCGVLEVRKQPQGVHESENGQDVDEVLALQKTLLPRIPRIETENSMSTARAILNAALDEIEAQADGMSAEYEQRLSDYRRNLATALADPTATPAQIIESAEQGANTLVSTLLKAGLEARAAAQTAALNVFLAVLRAGIGAVG